MKRIEITEAMWDALELVARGERLYKPGLDGRSLVELPRLALADATLEALRVQAFRATQRQMQLERLPAKAGSPVVVTSPRRPARRRRA